MARYTAERRSWLRRFGAAVASIDAANGSTYSPGFEYNQQLSPFDDGRRNLAYLWAKAVRSLTEWTGLPPNERYWSEFGAFLRGPKF